MESKNSNIMKILNIDMLNRVLKYNPNALSLLDSSETLCEILYHYEQYCIFFTTKSITSKDDKKISHKEMKCAWHLIDFDNGKFFDITGELTGDSLDISFDLHLLSIDVKEKILKYIDTPHLYLEVDRYKYSYKKALDTNCTIKTSPCCVLNYLSTYSKIYIDQNKFSKHMLGELQKCNSCILFDFEYRNKMKQIIEIATQFLTEYGGMVTGSASLAIYNFINDLPIKFIPNDIDVIFTDIEMYRYCCTIFLGYSVEGNPNYPCVFSCDKFEYCGFTVNIILPDESKPIKHEDYMSKYLKQKNNAIFDQLTVLWECKDEKIRNICSRYLIEDYIKYSSLQTNDYFTDEELEYMAECLTSDKVNIVYRCFYYYYWQYNAIIPENKDELTKKLQSFKKITEISNYIISIASTKNNKTFGFFINNTCVSLVRNELSNSDDKVNHQDNQYFLNSFREEYFHNIVLKNHNHYFEKSREYLRNKPEKKETDYQIVKNHVDNFDMSICKFIWTPENQFTLTNGHHPFISAKYGACVVIENKLLNSRFDKYASRGYKIIVVPSVGKF